MNVRDDAVRRILDSIEYVESLLPGAVRVADMAAAACWSEFHFMRKFNRFVWHSPYDYAMRRRLTAAAGEVIGGEASVLDIALEWGFESPDGFTRAFRRVFGVTPSEARAAGGVDGRRGTQRPDGPLLEFLGRCRDGGARFIEEDLAFPALAMGGDGPGEALASAMGLTGDGGWAGLVLTSAAGSVGSESNAGTGGGSAGGAAVQAFAEGKGPFRATVPAGRYGEIRFAGSAADALLIPAASDFAFRFRGGGDAPVDRLYLTMDESVWCLLLPDESSGRG